MIATCPLRLASILLALSATAFAQRTLKTIDGPETPELGDRVKGYIVMDRPVGGIVAYEFPGGREVVVRPAKQASRTGTVHAVAGPDRTGTIAYIENWAADKRHLLKTIRLDGSNDTEVFSREGDALWGKEIGDRLALSPDGAHVCFVGRHAARQLNAPSAYLMVGTLEVWNLAAKQQTRAVPGVLDYGLSWSRDGNTVAIVRFAKRSELRSSHTGPGTFGSGFAKWEELPVVCLYDVKNDTEVPLHVGWLPVVAEDGKSVLLRDWDGLCLRVPLDGTEPKLVTWPGDWRGPIALLENDLLIYWGLPTTGTDPKFTTNNSPLAGPKPEGCIKIGELNGTRFFTLIEYIDPRQHLAFARGGN